MLLDREYITGLKRDLAAQDKRIEAMEKAMRRAPDHCRVCENLDYMTEDTRCATDRGTWGEVEIIPVCELINEGCPDDRRMCPMFRRDGRTFRPAMAGI